MVLWEIITQETPQRGNLRDIEVSLCTVNRQMSCTVAHALPALPIAAHALPAVPIAAHTLPALPIIARVSPALPIHPHVLPALPTPAHIYLLCQLLLMLITVLHSRNMGN